MWKHTWNYVLFIKETECLFVRWSQRLLKEDLESLLSQILQIDAEDASKQGSNFSFKMSRSKSAGPGPVPTIASKSAVEGKWTIRRSWRIYMRHA